MIPTPNLLRGVFVKNARGHSSLRSLAQSECIVMMISQLLYKLYLFPNYMYSLDTQTAEISFFYYLNSICYFFPIGYQVPIL
jgi:hypothetical protein